MKHLYLISVVCLLAMCPTLAQESNNKFNLGFTFERSDNPSWGDKKLIIVSVDPNSLAEEKGLKKGDIITKIDGNATHDQNIKTILSWLNTPTEQVEITVQNVKSKAKNYTLSKKQIVENSISEKSLARIFNQYSLENSNNQSFSLPIRVQTNTNIDYSNYQTYNVFIDDDASALDLRIADYLERIMREKGFVKNETDPEIVVQTYYVYEPNPNHVAQNRNNESNFDLRYNYKTGNIIKVPVASDDFIQRNKLTTPTISFGITFYDRKYISKTQLTQIWDCEIQDYLLTDDYTFDEYLQLHMPFLLDAFPWQTNTRKINYELDYSRYNYTGIHFDINDLTLIKTVDENSPASQLGIEAGCVIKSINGKECTSDYKKMSAAYRQFIEETFNLRDVEVPYTSIKEDKSFAYWDKLNSNQINKAFENSEYLTNFAYLFNFESYINGGTQNTITIEVWDGVDTKEYIITPIVRQSSVLESIE